MGLQSGPSICDDEPRHFFRNLRTRFSAFLRDTNRRCRLPFDYPSYIPSEVFEYTPQSPRKPQACVEAVEAPGFVRTDPIRPTRQGPQDPESSPRRQPLKQRQGTPEVPRIPSDKPANYP